MQKILIADDSIAVRKVAERLLAEAGLGVVLAANGEEALAYLKKDCPDAIVSDVIMPDKSGYEVCAFVRATATLAATPVLLISGIVNDEVTKQAETCKADGVLKKPFQGTSLKDKVLELLSKRQKPSEAPESKSTSAPAAAPTIGIKAIQTSPPSVVQAPVPGPKLMQPPAAPPQSGGDVHAAGKLKDAEARFQAEQVRAETLVKRTVELEAELGRMKGVQALLEAERRRASELESKVEASESQASRVPQLEASLKTEQEATRKARQEASAAKSLAERVAQLEAELEAERVAEAQLVQQLSDMESAAAKAAHTSQQVVELQAALAAERQKGVVGAQAKEEAQAKVRELDGLLTSEREHNAALLRRVTESEQVALNATKRFEEVARKLGEIAGLASQLAKR
ncbi:MAG TPA: response regulator [Nitrospira sp.]|nr:response regulator [Nitrospira sp.]